MLEAFSSFSNPLWSFFYLHIRNPLNKETKRVYKYLVKEDIVIKNPQENFCINNSHDKDIRKEGFEQGEVVGILIQKN